MGASLRRALALACFAAALAAPAKPPLILATGDAGAALAADAGLLLVAIESDMPFASVKVARYEATKRKQTFVIDGSKSIKFNARVVVLPVGRYQVERVELESGGVWKPAKHQTKTAFEIKAGSLTYPGDLAVTYGAVGLRLDAADRSGRARVWVEESHRGLLARFPLRFAGADDDGWTETLVP